jgi:hypothetical protein
MENLEEREFVFADMGNMVRRSYRHVRASKCFCCASKVHKNVLPCRVPRLKFKQSSSR